MKHQIQGNSIKIGNKWIDCGVHIAELEKKLEAAVETLSLLTLDVMSSNDDLKEEKLKTAALQASLAAKEKELEAAEKRADDHEKLTHDALEAASRIHKHRNSLQASLTAKDEELEKSRKAYMGVRDLLTASNTELGETKAERECLKLSNKAFRNDYKLHEKQLEDKGAENVKLREALYNLKSWAEVVLQGRVNSIEKLQELQDSNWNGVGFLMRVLGEFLEGQLLAKEVMKAIASQALTDKGEADKPVCKLCGGHGRIPIKDGFNCVRDCEAYYNCGVSMKKICSSFKPCPECPIPLTDKPVCKTCGNIECQEDSCPIANADPMSNESKGDTE